VIGEIPGTDPALKDEIVTARRHFDSWHAGTGATDNAAGSAVMMEAICASSRRWGLKPRRTIRIGLWTGEEQGPSVRRAYVKAHFGTRTATRYQKAETTTSRLLQRRQRHRKIRGVYLQGNAGVKASSTLLQPFWANGAQTISFANTGAPTIWPSTGRAPGWQFIQDPVDSARAPPHEPGCL